MATQTRSSTPSQITQEPTPSCTTAVPGKYGNVPFDACNAYYNYSPQFAAAVAVTTLFGILTVTHVVEATVFKKRYCWVLIMGAAWETIGYGLYAAGAHDQQNIGYAAGHNILILLAPLWINAFAYMTFARMVYFFLPEKRVWGVKAASLAKYFVWADIVSFLVQAVGGVMASPGASAQTVKIGIDIYMGGIGLQEFFILFFASLMVMFHRRAIKLEQDGIANRERGWRPLLYTLYGVLLAITIRIIYRICEYATGVQPSNPVPFHEAYSYVLDAFPMLVAILLLAAFPTGRTLIGPESEFPRLPRKEKKALKRAKKDEKAARKAEKKARRKGRHEPRENNGAGWEEYVMHENLRA